MLSITALKLSKGCAPTNLSPLIKKAGVPSTPAVVPSAVSLLIFSSYLVEARQAANDVVSIPSSPAQLVIVSSAKSPAA